MRSPGRSARALAFLLCTAGTAAPRPALAEDTGGGNVAAARRHFDNARGLYGQGAYREALTELEAAHTLDPTAKDLVFNLGVVSEKLADIEEALRWFRLYMTMTLTDAERDRATAYVRRLEGAKKELDEKAAARREVVTPAASTQPLSSPAPTPASPPRGRIDLATLTAAGTVGAGLLFGTVMAIVAVHDAPASPFVTGRDGSYADLAAQTDSAHHAAILADLGFGVALAAGAAAAYLYFGRLRGAPAASPTAAGPTTVSALPVSHGGAVVLGGAF